MAGHYSRVGKNNRDSVHEFIVAYRDLPSQLLKALTFSSSLLRTLTSEDRRPLKTVCDGCFSETQQYMAGYDTQQGQ